MEHTDIYPSNADSSPGFTRVEPLITPAEIKEQFLWGIPLVDPCGNEIPMSLIERHWKGALSTIEHDLNVTVTPTQYVEYKDYRAEDYDNWFFIKLGHKPISHDVNKIKVEIQYIKDATLVELPKAWYRIYSESGQIQMTPTAGTMGQFLVSQAGIILPGLWGSKKDYPQLMKVTYVAGFEQDRIPPMVNQVIGYQTAIDVLRILSDMVLGVPGINSYGIGMDGMSQSVSREGFQRRIDDYKEAVSVLMDKLMKYYNSFTFASL